MELNVLDVLETKNLNKFQNLSGMFTDNRSISAIKCSGPNETSRSGSLQVPDTSNDIQDVSL